ncbi:tetratricopeptide repeat protein [Solirubrobacter sp. CPCC 204708]|uniref:Tetratricopeptide repeat protein n=1 Tax=Solirubrobacter deserti TaxID=2282478 RepID=A0ABT4RT77_9ACTN|nr:tetratricopeptide repeat protein [Solirubrobacter deserti]MBE2318439.1 tetratricopeptide repeat protein [Solirubrobacter deserti]MDA0141787.1 tetratricopeptide repeat protein [Solirubrobacter deserti]
METITFYSYKGGTGRTLLLANIASLAARMGRRVVVVDADLEAPGLGYKLFERPPTHSDGLVGWLRDYFATGEPPATLSDFLIDVPVTDPFVHGGWIRLITAGRAPSVNYFQQLAYLKLDERIATGVGVDAFVELKRQITEDIEPDLLLIDARTGISSTNRVSTRVLADHVVALSLDTPEQLEGTRSVMRSLTPLTSMSGGDSLGLHVVLSRVAARTPDVSAYEMTDTERAQVARVREFLCEPAEPLRMTLTVDRVHLLHSEPRLVAGDVLLLARSKVLDMTALHVDYLRLAEVLLGGVVQEVASSALGSSSDPEEYEHVARFFARQAEVSVGRGDRLTREPEAEDRRDSDLARRVERLRAMARQDPTLRGDLAVALMNLGRGFSDVGEHERAHEVTEEAVQIWRDLPTDEGPNLPLGSALNSLAIVRQALGRHRAAVEAAEEAVSLWRGAAERDPARGRRELAISLGNLAVVYNALGRREDSIAVSRESLTLWRALAEEDDGDAPALADALLRLAAHLHVEREPARVVEALSEAVALYRSQRAANPAAEPVGLATAMDAIAVAHAAMGHMEAAAEAAEEANHLWRDMVAANPGSHLTELAISLTSLSEHWQHTRGPAVAVEAARESVALLREAALADPEAASRLLPVALNTLGYHLTAMGDHAAARAASLEAVALLRTLAETDPGERAELARALHNLAVDESNSGDVRAAAQTQREAVEVLRALNEDDSFEATMELATGLMQLTGFFSEADDADAAVIAASEAVAIWRRLAEQDRARALTGLALSLRARATALGGSDPQAAVRDAQESVQLLREATRDGDSLAELAMATNNLAVDLWRLGDETGGLAANAEAVALWRRVAEQGHEDAVLNLPSALRNLAAGYARVGDDSRALEVGAQAVDLLREEAAVRPLVGGPALVGLLRFMSALAQRNGDLDQARNLRDESERVTKLLLA